ncbi:unnamed protein product [Thlaspi arvense]|uniref:Protein TIC 214 n=1 Tax=Thlaspi arvense TaxID=13288 RepID=A0AAU9RVK1_THLAR|nr:unnamed protein product [Thlaspi arvense]
MTFFVDWKLKYRLMIHELSVQKKYMEWTNSSLSEKKKKILIDRIKTIRNQTEEISKEKENQTTRTTSCNKPRYDSKRMESSKKSWQAFKRKNTRLILMTYALYHMHMYFTNYHKFKLAVLEYNICITSFFVKNKIKDFFQEQGLLNYELKDKIFFNSEVNPWKNWLRSHSQYNLPQIAWARLGKFRIENIWIGEFSTFGLEKKSILSPGLIPRVKKKYIKTNIQNYQRIDKITNKDLANPKSLFFDWMGINEEILNRQEKDSAGQGELESDKEKKNIEENYEESTITKLYCLLVRLKNPNEIAISSIERGEMRPRYSND